MAREEVSGAPATAASAGVIHTVAHGPEETLHPRGRRRRRSAECARATFAILRVWHFAFTLIVSGAAPGARFPLRTPCQTCGVPLIHTYHIAVNRRPPHRLLFTSALHSFGERHYSLLRKCIAQSLRQSARGGAPRTMCERERMNLLRSLRTRTRLLAHSALLLLLRPRG